MDADSESSDHLRTRRSPRRGKRRWILWGVPVFWIAVAAILIVPFGLVRFPGVRDWILDRSVENQLLAPGQRIRIDDVARLDPGGFDFRGVRVEAQTDSGWTTWFSVERVHANWNANALLQSRLDIGTVRVRSPRLDWHAVPNPVFAARRSTSKARVTPIDLPPIQCDSLEVLDAEIVQGGRPWLNGTLRLLDISHEAGDVAGLLEIGRVRSVRDSLELQVAHGNLRGKLIEWFSIDSMSVTAEGFSGALEATLRTAASGASRLSLEGTLAIEDVEPLAIVPLRRLDLPWDEEDRLRGSILFGGEVEPRQPPHGEFVMGLGGRVFDVGVDTLRIQADATPARAELVDFQVRAGVLEVRGTGTWLIEEHAAFGEAEFIRLDLAGPVVARFVELPSSDLSGRIEGRADSLGGKVRLRANVELAPGTFDGRSMAGIHARVGLDPRFVTLDTLWTGDPAAPNMRARGRLERSGPRAVELRGRFDQFPLSTWVDPWIDLGLEGMASGPFAISGSWERPELSADLAAGRSRIVEITADSVHVGPVTGTLRPFRLETPIEGRGLDFYGFKVDSLRAEGILADMISARAVGFRDTTRIELTGRVTPNEPGVVFLDEIVVQPGAAPVVELAHPTQIAFSKQRVSIDTVMVRSEVGSVTGSAWILPRPGRSEPFEFSLQGDSLDLGAIAQYLGLDADTLNGSARVVFTGRGMVDQPEYQFTLDAETTEIYGWLWQSIHLSGRAGELFGSPESLARNRGVATSPESNREPMPPESRGNSSGVVIDTLHAVAHGYVGRLPVLGPERVGPEPPGEPVDLRISRASIRSPKAWAEAVEEIASGSLYSVLEEAELDASISIRSVPAGPILAPVLTPRAKQGSRATFALETVDPMLAVIRTERPQIEETMAPSGMSGTVGVDLEIGGTGADPEIRATGLAEKLRIYQARADSVLFSATYVDSMLYLERFDWREGGRGLHASGEVPLRLRANPERVGLREEPLWIEAEIPSIDLSLASLFTALIEDPSGNLLGRLRLQGTPPHIALEGDFLVNNGAFRIPLREERLSNVEAKLHLDSLGVHILEATGKFNESGTARASGWYRDPSRFELEGTVRNALVFESGNYNFLADADLFAAPIAFADSTRPQLSGTVSVHEGAITMDLAKPGRQKVLVTPWIFDLDVVIPGNVRVIQPTSSVYVGSGRLQVHYEMPFWSLGGRVDVTSGHILIFNKNLRITEGTVEFLDTGTGPYPILDIRAQTEVVTTDVSGDRSETVVIEVQVQGSPVPGDGLEVTLSSPTHRDKSQEDLVDLLTIGQVESARRAGSASEPARGLITGQVLNSLERELITEAPWLDVVEVSGGTTVSDPIVISLRAITEPTWSLRYSQELASASGQEVVLTYRISNLFFLNAGADRKRGGETVGTANETYNLDFRLRVDY